MSPAEAPLGLSLIIAAVIWCVVWYVVKLHDAAIARSEAERDPNMGTCDGCTKRCHRDRLTPIESQLRAGLYCPRCTAEIRALRRSA